MSEDQQIAELCEFVAVYLNQGRTANALALASMSLVHSDIARYSGWSASSEHSKTNVEAAFAALQQAADQADGQPQDGKELHRCCRRAPLSLIHWLDHRLLTAEGALGTVPEWASANAVRTIELPPGAVERLQIPSHLSKVFIFRRAPSERRAPVQGQTHDPSRFLTHWEVVPHIPDARQRSRDVRVASLQADFLDPFREVEGTLKVYLAESAAVPKFDPLWTDGGDDWRRWVAKGLINEDVIWRETLQHLERALRLQAQVVVLPELIVPPVVLGRLQAYLAQQAVSGERASYPLLMVIAGSFHVSEAGVLYNRAVVLDGVGAFVRLRDDDSALTHDKLTRVQLAAAKIIEGNEVAQRITIFPTHIGTQCVVICLDLAQTAATDRLPLELLPTRWLWVPSLSEGVKAHQGRSKELCLQRHMTVSCANQAQADFDADTQLRGQAGESFVWTAQPGARTSAAATPVGSEVVLAGEAATGSEDARIWKLYDLSVD
jgi:predicted amidohydrolase